MNRTFPLARVALSAALLLACVVFSACQSPEERAMDRASRQMDRQMKAQAKMMKDMEKTMDEIDREMQSSD